MDGIAGKEAQSVSIYNLEKRRAIDAMLVDKSKGWLSRRVERRQSFFLYHLMIHLHWPALSNKDFIGKTGKGDFPDCMAEMDYRVDQIIGDIDTLGVRKNTVFIFASDNGPEHREPCRGTTNPWTGTYHTAMERSLWVLFIIRWPGKVLEGEVSNDMVCIFS